MLLLDHVSFFVNGKFVSTPWDPEKTVLQYLRSTLRITSAKSACGEGGCGACTVMISDCTETGNIRHFAANACLMPFAYLHGRALTTAEGLGSTQTKLHAVQKRLAESHGSQCGFCTPGFVMSMFALLRNTATPNMDEISKALEGNLCRCTGYRPILDAFRPFAKDGYTGCCRGPDSQGRCCMEGTPECSLGEGDTACAHPYAPSSDAQVAIFPPDLKVNAKAYFGKDIYFSENGVTWYRPVSLASLVELKAEFPNARLVGGSTEITLEVRFKKMKYPVLIDVSCIPELLGVTCDSFETGCVRIGGSTSLTSLDEEIKSLLSKVASASHTFGLSRIAPAADMLDVFAGTQVRNVATVAGNIVTGGPISDLNQLWLATACQLELRSKTSSRTVPFDETFFTGYRQTALKPDEVLVALRVPIASQYEYSRAYKQAQRRDDDIAIVNAAFRVELIPPSDADVLAAPRVKSFHAAFGGMAPTTLYLKRDTANENFAWRWDDPQFEQSASKWLFERTPLAESAPGAQIAYRRSLVLSFFVKFYIYVSMQLKNSGVYSFPRIDPISESALIDHRHLELSSCNTKPPADCGTNACAPEWHSNAKEQVASMDAPEREKEHAKFREWEAMQLPKHDAERQPTRDQYQFETVIGEGDIGSNVHADIPHLSAAKHCTGEAIYLPDVPPAPGEKFLTLVLSPHAHARIVSIDKTVALEHPGVVDVFSGRDIPEERRVPTGHYKEPILPVDEVDYHGQPVVAVVAADRRVARRAAKLVKIEYEILDSFITIEHAIMKHSFFESYSGRIEKSPECVRSAPNIEEALQGCDHCISLEMRIGGQEHFYFESQGAICVPTEDGGMDAIVSTQNMNEIQSFIANTIGASMNRVRVSVKRLGGGFGGKESRTILVAMPTAFAANKLNCPVRCVLSREEDMRITGGRHSMLCWACVGFSKEGKLSVLRAQVYSNAGHSIDLSGAVMDRCLLSLDGCYKFDTVSLQGKLCKTNLPSRTAFRGFGAPQGMFFMETIIDNVAEFLGKTPFEIRELNFYKRGDLTHFNQPLFDFNLDLCWEECIRRSSYHTALQQVQEFNRNNKYRKRGVALIPTRYNISFGVGWLNQGGALVNIYVDGSILVSHGGIEMGQGLHTKMIQVASRALGVPIARFHIDKSTTEVVPNTSATAASMSSDLNGMAVLNACRTLSERLEPFRRAHPSATWNEVVHMAYMDRVSLSATGFYHHAHTYDMEKNEGFGCHYFVAGAACSVVEIDTLTGHHQALRTDIVMDLGDSLNPAIDVGQIEGAFMQGYGLFMLEEYRTTPSGQNLTTGPGFYKIPSLGNVPGEFNVALLKGTGNPRAVYSSRAVGEPPLFLSSSVFFATKEAIRAARSSSVQSASEHPRSDAEVDPTCQCAQKQSTDLLRLDSPATAEQIRMLCSDEITAAVSEAFDSSVIPHWVRI